MVREGLVENYEQVEEEGSASLFIKYTLDNKGFENVGGDGCVLALSLVIKAFFLNRR